MSTIHPSWKLVNRSGGWFLNISAVKRSRAIHDRRRFTFTITVSAVSSSGRSFVSMVKHWYRAAFGSKTSCDSLAEDENICTNHSTDDVETKSRLSKNKASSWSEFTNLFIALSANVGLVLFLDIFWPAKKERKRWNVIISWTKIIVNLRKEHFNEDYNPFSLFIFFYSSSRSWQRKT